MLIKYLMMQAWRKLTLLLLTRKLQLVNLTFGMGKLIMCLVQMQWKVIMNMHVLVMKRLFILSERLRDEKWMLRRAEHGLGIEEVTSLRNYFQVMEYLNEKRESALKQLL